MFVGPYMERTAAGAVFQSLGWKESARCSKIGGKGEAYREKSEVSPC